MNTLEKKTATLKTSVFTIEGMTCDSCVKTITEKISTIKDVASVEVDLEKKDLEILASRKIDLAEVSQALLTSPKYKVGEHVANQNTIASSKTTNSEKSLIITYKPLIVVFTYILLASVAYQVNQGSFHLHLFMSHVMAGFFLSLSFFKFLDLKAFAESFSGYDPLAKRWLNYGYIYPFVELSLGLMFIAQITLLFANIMTVAVLTLTTIGVYKKLQSKNNFQCACLGTTFNLPLSNVTIAENVVMILMAVYAILRSGA